MAADNAYAAAGVDVAAGERAVELMKDAVAGSRRPEVIGGLGGFAGFFDASAFARYRRPVLATSTDGVGTKVVIARELGIYDTIGADLVGMLVDDLVVTGAEPLFVTDYIACGKVHPERIAAIVRGIAEACTAAGAALLGGETAEHPGLMAPDDFDVAGATTGVVEHDDILGPERVIAGDVVLALASSGLHSNGFSLVRAVFDKAGWGLDRHVPELGTTLGEALLTPTRVYARDLLAVIRATEVHAISHITGGGLANNLVRVIPDGIGVDIDRSSWTPAPVFGLVQQVGRLSTADVEATLNQGIGMALVLPETAVASALAALRGTGIDAWVAGRTVAEPGRPARVDLNGDHPAR